MNNKLINSTLVNLGIFILIIAFNLNSIQAQDNSKVHYLSIKKIGKEWKVVDANDNSKTQ